MNRSAQKALQSTAVGQVASKRKGSVKSQKQPKEVIVADFSMQLKAFGFTTSWPYKSFHDLKVGKDEDPLAVVFNGLNKLLHIVFVNQIASAKLILAANNTSKSLFAGDLCMIPA
jgi:hypothetical protein